MENNNKIVLFKEKQVRRVWYNDEWYFSIIDIIEVLTESTKPSNYWDTLKRRENQLSANCGKFKFKAADGKMRSTECANTEGMLRIVQSIPSPNAEPFKQWLAKVGYERIQEIENPELGIERVKEIYRAKGYDNEWIDSRVKSIDIRKQLTDEWKKRGVKEGEEYSILTAEIAKATFGLTPTEHKSLKKLEKQNLRDHMTNLELIFSMLGEESTRQIAIEDDSEGFHENKDAALKGGKAAGNARKIYEKTRNVKVVTAENYLHLSQAKNAELTEGGDSEAASKDETT